MTPRIGYEFVDRRPGDSDETLGIVPFSIFPHLDHPGWSTNTAEAARQWARNMSLPAYALDDQSAIVVDGDRVEVVSEGNWERLVPPRSSAT